MNDSRDGRSEGGDGEGEEDPAATAPSDGAVQEQPAREHDRGGAEQQGDQEPEGGADATGDPLTDYEGIDTTEDVEALRRRVEEEYDFESFGATDMAEMEPEEWEAAFDPDSWITGEALLDRVEADLQHRVATRDVFAVVERVTHEGEPHLLAYTDDGYAMVGPDGSVEGFGTVLRDTKPVVALCSMAEYDVPEPPEEDFLLPHPEEVPEGSGELGNLMMQVVAGTLLLAGLVLFGTGFYFVATEYLGAPAYGGAGAASGGAIAVTVVVAFVFVAVGLALFATVANARLSDAFRAEEYRERLRSMGLDGGERPDFLPVEGRARELDEEDRGGT